MGVLRELTECKKALTHADRMLELIEYRLAIPGANGLLPEEVVELRRATDSAGRLSHTLEECITIQERIEGVRNDTVCNRKN